MTADTRKDKRASVQLKVRFKSATVDEFIEQYAVDISRGGIFIKSKQPMAIGTLLKFEFQLKDESRLIHGVGRVVWKREEAQAGGPDKPAGMGVKFIKMDPESKALVDRIVDARGDREGAYEAGGGDSGELTPGGAPRAKPSGSFDASALAPAKKQEGGSPFFPSTSAPSDMPAPEDRTQVRHASEFLASALGAAGEDVEAAAEAEKRAAEARKRSEEIERQRARDAAAAKRDEEAARLAAERAEAERRSADAADAKRRAMEEHAATEMAVQKPPRLPTAEPVRARAEPVPASRPSDRPAAVRVPSVPPAAPPAEPRSRVGLIAVVVVLLLGAGGVGAWQMGFFGGSTSTGDGGGTVGTEAEDAGATAANDDAGAPSGDDAGAQVAATDDAGTQGAATGAEDAGTAAATTNVAVRIESTPPGATILVAGQEKGTTPTSVDLPTGTTTTLTLRLAGYSETTHDVRVGDAAPPTVRVTMPPMAWAIVVDSTPPGARATAAGHSVVTPGTIVLGGRPRGAVTITVSKPGFEQGHATVLIPEYSEEEGQMRRHVSVALSVHAGGGHHPPGGGENPPGGGENPPGGGGENPPGGGGENHPPGGGDTHPPGGGDTHPPGGGGDPLPDNPFG